MERMFKKVVYEKFSSLNCSTRNQLPNRLFIHTMSRYFKFVIYQKFYRANNFEMQYVCFYRDIAMSWETSQNSSFILYWKNKIPTFLFWHPQFRLCHRIWCFRVNEISFNESKKIWNKNIFGSLRNDLIQIKFILISTLVHLNLSWWRSILRINIFLIHLLIIWSLTLKI